MNHLLFTGGNKLLLNSMKKSSEMKLNVHRWENGLFLKKKMNVTKLRTFAVHKVDVNYCV